MDRPNCSDIENVLEMGGDTYPFIPSGPEKIREYTVDPTS
jgi:hypothetical protein